MGSGQKATGSLSPPLSSFTSPSDSYLWKPKKTIVVLDIYSTDIPVEMEVVVFCNSNVFVTLVLFCHFDPPRAYVQGLKYSLCLVGYICPLF